MSSNGNKPPGVPTSPGTDDKAAVDLMLENEAIQENLLRIAHMFSDYRDDPLMRELCRLAILCAQERLIRA